MLAFRFLIILAILTATCIENTNAYARKIDIVVRGNGGDKNGAILIKKYLENKKGVIVNMVDRISQRSIGDIWCYLVIGQSAALDFIQNNHDIKTEKIFIYSHILSSDIVSFAKEHKNVRLITTKAESGLLKDYNGLITVPLAIPTYLKSEGKVLYEQNKLNIDKILQYPAVHIGGSYKDRNGNDIFISDTQFASVKEKLKIKENQDISVIVHPRTFKDILSDISLIKNRLVSIAGSGGIKNTYFFVNKELYNIVLENPEYFSEFNILISPPYSGILYGINEIGKHKEQYVSADQYNAFADIKSRVNGFLLNEEDYDQAIYLEYYNQLDLNADILSGFLSVIW